MRAVFFGLMLIARCSVAAPYEQCFNGAAAFHHVNSLVLTSIAKVESNYNPAAINRNRNGTYDYGLMQINSSWFPELRRWGVDPGVLRDPCANIYIGAWILSKSMWKYGNTWHAVGAYNTGAPSATGDKYAYRVWREIMHAR